MVNEEFNMDLITKYLNGELSAKEAQNLTNWVKESEENKNTFIRYKDVWFASKVSNLSSDKADIAWRDFEKNIEWEEENTNHQLSDKKTRYLFNSFFRWAVAILILIGSVASVLVLRQNIINKKNIGLSELVVTSGKKETLELSDGTKVWLNSESKLLYPEKFMGKERKVFLTGEAYFEVAKNKRKPFIIETSDLLVQVLGTSFNICSYTEDSYIVTTLVSGEVQISGLQAENNILKILEPNQKATFFKETKEIELSYVDVNLYTSWTNNNIIFNNLKFSEVITRLERWYNVKLEYNENLFSETRITAKFLNDESLIEVLDVLKIPGKFNYSVIGSTIILDEVRDE